MLALSRLSFGLVAAAACFAEQVAPADPAKYVAEHHSEETLIVQGWLLSGDARTRAWGAHIAGSDRLSDLVPALLRIVESAPADPMELSNQRTSDAAAILISAVDALIQMNAEIPAEASYSLYNKMPDVSLILLARSSDRETYLTKIFHEEKHALFWLAAGNLLAEHPPAWFVRELLQSFVTEVKVIVTNPRDSGDDSVSGSGCAYDGGMMPSEYFKSWPKVNAYRLERGDVKSASQLAPGLNPVGFSSWKTSNYTSQFPSDDCWAGRLNEYRYGLLAQLAQEMLASFPLKQRTSANITYTEKAAYLEALRRLLREQGRISAAVCVRYEELGLLTIEDASAFRINVALRVVDQREPRSEDLPAFQPNIDIGVKIVADPRTAQSNNPQ